MDISTAEKIFETMQKFKKYSCTAKVIGQNSLSEVMMLRLIRNNTDNMLTISLLSELLAISKPAVSQMINVLEDKGYVERITTKKDRRIVYIKITNLGICYLEEKRHFFTEKINQLFEKMGDEDTKTLHRLLDKLYNIVCENKN